MITPAKSLFSPSPPLAFPPPTELQLSGPGNTAPEALTNPFGNNPQTGGNNNQLLLPNLGRASSLGNLGTSVFGLQPSSCQNPAISPTAPRLASYTAARQGRTQQTPTQRTFSRSYQARGLSPEASKLP